MRVIIYEFFFFSLTQLCGQKVSEASAKVFGPLLDLWHGGRSSLFQMIEGASDASHYCKVECISSSWHACAGWMCHVFETHFMLLLLLLMNHAWLLLLSLLSWRWLDWSIVEDWDPRGSWREKVFRKRRFFLESLKLKWVHGFMTSWPPGQTTRVSMLLLSSCGVSTSSPRGLSENTNSEVARYSKRQ